LSFWYSHAAYYRLWRGSIWYIASNVLQRTATNFRVTDGGAISRTTFKAIAKDSYCNTLHSTICVCVCGGGVVSQNAPWIIPENYCGLFAVIAFR
jgi:hypothetical protein